MEPPNPSIWSLCSDENWETRDSPLMLAFSSDALVRFVEAMKRPRPGPIEWDHSHLFHVGFSRENNIYYTIQKERWVDDFGEIHDGPDRSDVP